MKPTARLRIKRTNLYSLCTIAFLGLLLTLRSAAQAPITADRTIGLSAFGGYINSNPEYGPDRNTGIGVGVDITRFIHFPVQPALEFRANLTNGTDVNEKSYLIGLRGQADFVRILHPYVDFLIGTGTIHFNAPSGGYTGDNSTVYDFGGGVDIDLIRHFQLRADYQYQSWNLGQNSAKFTPNLILIGVNYNFHFRDNNKENRAHY